MISFGSTNSKNHSRSGILGLFEDDFENESSIRSSATSVVTQTATGILEAVLDLGQTVTGMEDKTESKANAKFPTTGSIEFNKQQAQIEQLQKQQAGKEKADQKRVFFQALKEDQERAQKAKEKLLFEEEINDIVTNLPTEQKNELLHYQASYKDRSIYQRAELRKKLIEQRRKAEKQQKQSSIPSPAKQPSAIEGAFEGRSGTQGGGSANLSAQAVG